MNEIEDAPEVRRAAGNAGMASAAIVSGSGAMAATQKDNDWGEYASDPACCDRHGPSGDQTKEEY